MRKIFLAALLAAIAVTGLKAQRIDSLIAVNADRNPIEKAYLHFDKSVYAPGETVWFKAYLQSAFQPSDISKSFYVDWTDEDGNVIFHSAAPIVEGTARGQFVIPKTFTGDWVRVHAYTLWMLNSDSAFLFNRNLRITQTAKKTAAVKKEYETRFFAESGNIIGGVNNRVAFKATDQWGLPAAITGRIVDSKGTKTDSIITQHDGMGMVSVSPAEGEVLIAVWKDPSGVTHRTALPAPTATAAFSIRSAPGKRNFLVQRSENAPPELKTLFLVATMQQQLVYRARVNLTETMAIGGSLPVGNLPSGVLVFTLFDQNWRPVAERISFVNNGNYDFKPDVQVFQDMKHRGKTSIEIEVPDSAAASMSLAVTDADADPGSQENILSHLMLTSDLRGYIHRPAYYFTNASDTLAQRLDLVMMTNGWRRINWEQLVSGTMLPPKFPRDTSYLSFSGKVFGASPAQLREAKSINIIIRGKDSSTNVVSLPIRPDGSFSDPDMMFYDTIHLYYQFAGRASLTSATAITFKNGLYSPSGKWDRIKPVLFSGLPDTSGFSRSRFYAQEAERLLQLQRELTLKGVTVTTRAKSPMQQLDEKYTSGLFAGGDARSFDIGNDPIANASLTVFNYLQGRVAGLTINTAGNPPTVSWRGSNTSFFLNEMNTQADQLLNIPMSDVAYVKVFPPPFFGASGGGAGGAIAVYTKKGGDARPTGGKGLDSKSLAGYTPYKQFYSPNYASFEEHADQPDLRSTLYWSPYVQTDPKNHHVLIQFYNNDVSKRFRVTLEGMDKEGRLAHSEQVVE